MVTLHATARRQDWRLAATMYVLTAYVLTALVYIAIRISIFWTAQVIDFPDSESYVTKAVSPLDWDFFFGGGRFFMVPLLYKVTSALFGAGTSVTWMQLAVSCAAWLTLARAFATVLSLGTLGFLGFVAALLLSLSSDVTQWDRAILSESISTSLFVLFLAAWIRLGDGVTGRRFATLLAASVLFGLTREANSLFLPAFAVMLLWWAVWYLRGQRAARLACVAVAGVWLGLVLLTTAVAQHGERWVFPLLNVIGRRVLTSPERTAFYERQGMPMTDRLRAMAGEFASGDGWAFYHAPELEEFRRWLHTSGRAAFARDLAQHPQRSVLEPLRDVDQIICPDLSVYRPKGLGAVLPDIGQTRACARPWALRSVIASLVVGLGLVGLATFLRRRLDAGAGFKLVTGAAMLLGWLPVTWFTWQVIGDMEIGRHVLAGTFQFRLAVLFVVGYAALAVRTRILPVPALASRAI